MDHYKCALCGGVIHTEEAPSMLKGKPAHQGCMSELKSDRAYLAGLNRGYALGVAGREQDFQTENNAYRRVKAERVTISRSELQTLLDANK